MLTVRDLPTSMLPLPAVKHQYHCIGILMWGNLKPGEEKKELKRMPHTFSIHIKELQVMAHKYLIQVFLGFLDHHHLTVAA